MQKKQTSDRGTYERLQSLPRCKFRPASRGGEFCQRTVAKRGSSKTSVGSTSSLASSTKDSHQEASSSVHGESSHCKVPTGSRCKQCPRQCRNSQVWNVCVKMCVHTGGIVPGRGE